MFSFLARLSTPTNSPVSSRTGSPSSTVNSPSSLSAAFASDPFQWERTFDKCWEAVERLLDKKSSNLEYIIPYDDLSHLLSQLTQMNELLMMEVNSQPESVIGPILDRYFTQQIMERIMDWALQVPDGTRPICQLALIRIYETIVGESHTQNHCLLVHKPILNPLLRLFQWCKRMDGPRPSLTGEPSINDKHFVLLLNQICTKLAEDKTLLHFFFTYHAGSEQFPVFSLLVPFLYEQNDVGQLARDAVLLILAVSKDHDGIAEFVALKSCFCPVVTGLSGCFSQLPRILAPEGSDRLVPDQYSEVLNHFISSVIYCDTVAQVSHSLVVTHICNFFYSGFLVSVVKPALLLEELESVAASTIYLHLCLSGLKEPSLIKTVVRLLSVERDERGSSLLDIIVERIKGHDRLASASVQLLDTIINLACEDVMVMLTLRNLLPLRFSSQQLGKIYDTFYTQSLAQKLLECVPQCVLKVVNVCSSETVEEYIEEGVERVNSFASKCGSWKWRYDGVKPNAAVFRSDSDDEMNLTTLTRMSSVRSSMTSGRGLNRYAASRGSHLTADSNLGTLADLGAQAIPQEYSDNYEELVVEEDEDFQLPPVSMSTSMVDYFQLAAFDDLSEGDDVSSPDIQVSKPSLKKQFTDSGTDSDSAMARSFVLSGWSDINDMDTFLSLLDKQPLSKDAANCSTEECISYINARIQYWDELKITPPDIEVERKESTSSSILDSNMIFGLPIDPTTSPSEFLDAIFSQLESMFDHSYTYNLHFTSLLTSLAAYPLPLLTIYLYDRRKGEGRVNLIEALMSLKQKIDQLTANIEGIEVWIVRAMKTLQSRVDRAERAGDGLRHQDEGTSPISFFIRGSRLGASGRKPRYHIHKAVESPETMRDDDRTKNIVYAAIVVSNLVQSLAGIILHQSAAIVRHQ